MRIPAAFGLLLLLGLGASATAKDLPRAEPVKKATGCEWAGPDFVKAEGTDTCVRFGGSVRAEFSTSRSKTSGFPTSSGN